MSFWELSDLFLFLLFIFQTDGTVIVALDANFGLVRKKSSGSSITEPLQGNRMFVRDEDVEEYVRSNPDNCQPTEVSKYHISFSILVIFLLFIFSQCFLKNTLKRNFMTDIYLFF